MHYDGRAMPMRPPVHNPFPKLVRQHQARDLDRREHVRHSERFNAHQRGYTREWRKVSTAFLQAHPLCSGFDSRCEERGLRVPATEVDHTIPHRGSMRIFWDQTNWQALCHRCHSRKTAREDGGFGRPVVPQRERIRMRGPLTLEGQAQEVGTQTRKQTTPGKQTPEARALGVDPERARRILI